MYMELDMVVLLAVYLMGVIIAALWGGYWLAYRLLWLGAFGIFAWYIAKKYLRKKWHRH